MITVDAVNRSSGSRLEGDLGVFSALTAFNRDELAGGGRSKGHCSILSRFLRSFSGASGPASWTALGWMVVAFRLEGLLFFHRENVRGFTFEAD